MIFVRLVLVTPAYEWGTPIPLIDFKAHRQKGRWSVDDACEQRNETPVKEQFGAESNCAKGVTWAEHPAAGVAKTLEG